jgi:hypothetical protein
MKREYICEKRWTSNGPWYEFANRTDPDLLRAKLRQCENYDLCNDLGLSHTAGLFETVGQQMPLV